MKRSTFANLHRWFAVPFAVALVAWLGSGILFLLPSTTPDALAPGQPRPPSWDEAHVSPARATEAIREHGDTSVLRSVTLAVLDGDPVYRVSTRQGGHIVDARTGEQVTVDEALAVRLARAGVRDDVETDAVELLRSHSRLYPAGPLPAYRVRFRTGDRSWAYVSVATGDVQYSSLETRVRTALISFHDFRILRTALGSWVPNNLLLWAATLGMFVVAITGYYLAFWKSWRVRTPRARSTDS